MGWKRGRGKKIIAPTNRRCEKFILETSVSWLGPQKGKSGGGPRQHHGAPKRGERFPPRAEGSRKEKKKQNTPKSKKKLNQWDKGIWCDLSKKAGKPLPNSAGPD